MRLAKFIGRSGYCSRRAASRLIDAGSVKVNGQLAGHLNFVSDTDEISVDGKPLTVNNTKYYIAYHKPVGIDCNVSLNDSASIVHHVDMPKDTRLFPIGRLDKDSRGLILLTNDGDCCHQLLSPQYKRDKQYIVSVRAGHQRAVQGCSALDQAFVNALSSGIMLDGQLTLPCQVKLRACNEFSITLKQGLNRQIRKMVKSQGFEVIDLKRVSFANVLLDDLNEGAQRSLSLDEIAQLTTHGS